jgi:hypothetical protein
MAGLDRPAVRRMRARRLPDGRVVVSAEDMPGGATIHPRANGFRFSPYVIRTRVLGPLRLPMHYTDEVTVSPDGRELTDELSLRILGIRIAEVSIRLRRER